MISTCRQLLIEIYYKMKPLLAKLLNLWWYQKSTQEHIFLWWTPGHMMIVFGHWVTYTTPLNFTRFYGIIKAFCGMCMRLTTITFPVISWSVLISVTWVALLWAAPHVFPNIRDLKIQGRRRQTKPRWKSEFAFFQSSSRLLRIQVTNFFKCRWTLLKLNP